MSEPAPHAGLSSDPGYEGTDVVDARAGDPFDDEPQPTPWYRRPVLLIAWLVVVLVLIGLIVFGLTELLRGQPATGHTPSTTTSTSTSTTESTTPTTTATTTEPTTSDTGQPSPQRPSQQPTNQSTQQPSHRHHLPPLPPVITIPQVPTVITVPPGLR